MKIMPLRASFRTQFLLGFLACAALLSYAVYEQVHGGLNPCPLCIFQRTAFIALGVVFLVGGLHAPRGSAGRRVYGVLGLIAGLVGAGIATRHVWLHLHPPAMPSCGPSLDFLRETLSTGNLIRRVFQGSGDCAAVDWTFLGLSMPAWGLMWFLALGLWALWAGLRRR